MDVETSHFLPISIPVSLKAIFLVIAIYLRFMIPAISLRSSHFAADAQGHSIVAPGTKPPFTLRSQWDLYLYGYYVSRDRGTALEG